MSRNCCNITTSVNETDIIQGVWSYPDSNTSSSTMGQRQVDSAKFAKLGAIK